ncbi:MAG: ADP-forming succinate--CoA ligase subunit beta [Chlamydiia bacterium]
MHLHEYQAKELLKVHGVTSPPFVVIDRLALVSAALKELGTQDAVVKVQVHAGGRGKAGGVRMARGSSAVNNAVDALLGLRIVNEQTGPAGLVAEKVLLTPPVAIAREFYLAITIDRGLGKAVLMLSAEGGMDIEEVAVTQPHRVLRQIIPSNGKLWGYQITNLVHLLELSGPAATQCADLLQRVVTCFLENDCSLLEINPLVLTEEGQLLALDAKMSIDDNALYRHVKLSEWFDPSQLAPQEVQARAHDLSYVALDGEIGCMVNGAGLAMATMDVIQQVGGRPANFLDVGGSATRDKVAEAFRIIAQDPKVKAILVNIFGGIMNCVVIAEGILEAMQSLDLKIPLVVRLEGTQVEEARKILQMSGLPIESASHLDEAARRVVQRAGERR